MLARPCHEYRDRDQTEIHCRFNVMRCTIGGVVRQDLDICARVARDGDQCEQSDDTNHDSAIAHEQFLTPNAYR